MKRLLILFTALMLLLCGCKESKPAEITTPTTETTAEELPEVPTEELIVEPTVEETTAAASTALEDTDTPEQIITKLYAIHAEIGLPLDEPRPVDLNDADAVKMNLGLDSAEKLSAAALGETMMGQPFSLVVARVKDAADAADVAKAMLDGIDTRKWVCMMADDNTAAYCGNVVMYFMVNSEYADTATAKTMAEAFNTLCGGNAVILK